MNVRLKSAIIFGISLLMGLAGIMVISVVHWHGYALLPFVIIVGASLYIAFAAFLNILIPTKLKAEDALSYWLLDLLFGRFFH